MFYNMLQEGDGTEIGWLFYSTKEVDTGTLTDEIMDINGINIGVSNQKDN